MTKNKLFSSGQTITLAVGETYVLKEDEVFINGHIYKKIDLEIKTSNNHEDNNANDVKVGIDLRDGLKSLPAYMFSYDKWEIDGIIQTSLSDLVNNINTSIQ